MVPEVRSYLDEIRLHLRLDPATERQVMGEIWTHFQEKLAELKDGGLSTADAARRAIDSFGKPRHIARLTYEAFGKGSWSDAFLAALPHVLAAMLFATHQWDNQAVAALAMLLVVSVTLFGWWHSKPNWSYSWIGYSLVPLLVLGYVSHMVPEQAVQSLLGTGVPFPSVWWLTVVLAFYGCALWVVCRTAIKVVRRDWILASVMLVPIPIVGSWFYLIERTGRMATDGIPAVHAWDASMAMAFLALAAASASFIRIRKRAWKLAAVVLISSTTMLAVGPNLWGDSSVWQLVLFSLMMMVFLLSPALIEAKVGHGEQDDTTWWNAYWRESSSMARHW